MSTVTAPPGTAHWRMQSHLRGQKSKQDSNPLWRHDRECHEGIHQDYEARILVSERNLLPLCIMESLYIEKQQPETSLNDRNEFGRGGIIRLSANRIT